MFIAPMLASPLPNLKKNPKAKPFILEPNEWEAEEKFDGIRIVTEISGRSDKLFVEKGITPWTRYQNIRPHPSHIEEVLAQLPDCILDGELAAPGLRSYGTMEIANSGLLVYYVFDILQFEDVDITVLRRDARRSLLKDVLSKTNSPSVQLAESTPVNTWDEVLTLRDQVWARDGEGLILKRNAAPYIPGKRSKDFRKIKGLECSPFTVIGFVPSRGEINDRGPYAMVRLRDADGNITGVKTLNDAELAKFENEADHRNGPALSENHPAIGRTLWCEWQERTPDGSYRHIRWNHWEGE